MTEEQKKETPPSPKRGRGRPKTRAEETNKTYIKGQDYKSELTSKKKELVLALIEKGHTAKEAILMLEIPSSTLTYWRTTDNDFSDALIRAQLKLKSELVSNIVRSGQKDWRANAWLLERLPQFKDEFSGKTTIAMEEQNSSSSLVINMINQVLQVKDPALLSKVGLDSAPAPINLLAQAREEEEGND